MNSKIISLAQTDAIPFHNNVDFCVGTGRMGLALQKEYMEQLKLVQDYIGFQHIRGHGLFCDDMAIYQQERDGSVTYNFTYLDRVMDGYRSLGLKPFLELGFMPDKMASGRQTIFYWKGNVTPPKSYEAWTDMVQALLEHLCGRYGREEVVTWPVEVWNEPNLPGFWKGADMEEYFKLFHLTFQAVKEVDARFRVGGPAVCGGSDEKWIRAFLEYCAVHKLPVDFVTRHHYTTEVPDHVGHYGYAELMKAEDGFANLRTTRDIIDSFPEYRGLEIHITEFNTSYIPNCPLHDTNQNAAFLAQQLSRLGDGNESYSYWTFGDVFEEQGVPFTPFHGGFGLVANGCIPKPTFWTFVFFKKLKEKEGICIYRDDNAVVLRYPDGSRRGVLWNMTNERTGKALEFILDFPKEEEGCLLTRLVDEEHCNPLKVWHDLGEPANPTGEETALLREASLPYTRTLRPALRNGARRAHLVVEENGVLYFQWTPGEIRPDLGYSYERTMQYPQINPVTRLDYPDPDVIRVEDTYYMVSTTMYFMPGCEILRSYDLRNWEHAAYVYETLDGTPAQKLQGGRNIYGKGMWAASLRYRKDPEGAGGTFYVCFVANDTRKTYLYTARDIQGPWEKKEIKGFYHDSSLLFDDDGSVYIAYGNRDIYITQLKEDLSGSLEGGLHRLAVSDRGNPNLGYEGSHFYKIHGKYYLFLIHSRPDRWRRTESCFVADSLEGEFTGGEVLDDDRGYFDQGVAQGGIVETTEGKWYALLFQDSGAVGRLPVLVPVTWRGDRPVFGTEGRIPETFSLESTRPGYEYRPLVESDDFRGELKPCWQFNHEPDWSLIEHDREKGIWKLVTAEVCGQLTQAVNTLTQRMLYPGCAAEVTVDGSGLGEGDYAGLCALQGQYAMIALTRREGKLYLAMQAASQEEPRTGGAGQESAPAESGQGDASVGAGQESAPAESGQENASAGAGQESAPAESGQGDASAGAGQEKSGTASWRELASLPLEKEKVRLKLEADFADRKDVASFYYWKQEGERSFFGHWEKLGPAHKLHFRLDHFTGCRFGLALYSTLQAGGAAEFSDFRYRKR